MFRESFLMLKKPRKNTYSFNKNILLHMLVFGNCNVTKIATSMEAMISSVDACATPQCKAVRRPTYTKPNIVGISI